eukprot:Clim_evm18s236 gene=Clim_evmTU18s236
MWNTLNDLGKMASDQMNKLDQAMASDVTEKGTAQIEKSDPNEGFRFQREQELESQVQELTGEKASLSNQVRDLDSKVLDLEKRLKTVSGSSPMRPTNGLSAGGGDPQMHQRIEELESQLAEKDQKFAELESTAKEKFNKLRLQAKAKVTALERQLQEAKSNAAGGEAAVTAPAPVVEGPSEGELKVLEETIQRLMERIEVLQQQLMEAQDSAAPAAAAADTSAEIQKLSAKMKDIEAERDHYKETYAQLHATLTEKLEVAAEKEADLRRQMELALHGQSDEREALVLKVRELESALLEKSEEAALGGYKEESANAGADSGEDPTVLKEQIEELERSLLELKDLNQQQAEQLNSRLGHENDIEQLKDDMQDLRDANSRLEKQLKEAQEAKTGTELNVQESTEEIMKLTNEIAARDATVAQLQHQLAQGAGEIEEVKKAGIDAARGDVERLQREFAEREDEYRTQIEGMTQEMGVLRQTVETVQNDYTDSELRIQQALDAQRHAENELVTKDEEMMEMQSRNANLQNQVEHGNSDMNARIMDLEATLEAKDQQLQEAQKSQGMAGELEQMQQQHEMALDDLQNQILEMKQEHKEALETAQREVESLRTDLGAAETAAAAAATAAAAGALATAGVSSVSVDSTTPSEAAVTSGREVEDLKQKLKVSEGRFAKLKMQAKTKINGLEEKVKQLEAGSAASGVALAGAGPAETEEVDNLRTELQRAETMHGQLQQRLHEEETLRSHMEQRLQDMMSDQQERVDPSEHAALKVRCDELAAKLDRLQSLRNSGSVAKINELQERMSTEFEGLKASRARVQDMAMKLQSLVQSAAEGSQNVAAARGLLSTLAEEQQRLGGERDDTEEYAALESTLGALRASVDNMTRRQAGQASADEELNRVMQEHTNMTAQLQQRDEELTVLQQAYEQTQSQLSALGSDAEAQSERLQQRIKQLEEDLAWTQQQADRDAEKLRTEQEAAIQDNERLHQEVEDLQEQLLAREEEASEQHPQETAEQTAAMHSLQSTNAQLTEQVNALINEKDQLSSQMDGLHQQLHEAQQQAAQSPVAAAAGAAMPFDVTTLTQQLGIQSDADIQRVLGDLQQKDTHIKDLQQQIGRLEQQQVSSTQQTNLQSTTNRQEEQRLHSQIEALSDEVRRLRSAADEDEQELTMDTFKDHLKPLQSLGWELTTRTGLDKAIKSAQGGTTMEDIEAGGQSSSESARMLPGAGAGTNTGPSGGALQDKLEESGRALKRLFTLVTGKGLTVLKRSPYYRFLAVTYVVLLHVVLILML